MYLYVFLTNVTQLSHSERRDFLRFISNLKDVKTIKEITLTKLYLTLLNINVQVALSHLELPVDSYRPALTQKNRYSSLWETENIWLLF